MENKYRCAFPSDYVAFDNKGLTKREYFAVMAMNGMLRDGTHVVHGVDTVTEYAVECADSLLKALNKTK